MTSRNTAPRLSIDFGPGCFPRPNKSDIPPRQPAGLMAGLQLLALALAPRLCPFSSQASFSTPIPASAAWSSPRWVVTGTIPVVKLEPGQEQMPSD